MTASEPAVNGQPPGAMTAQEAGAPQEVALVPGSADWDLHVPAAGVDAKDADTPDNWVPRDPRIQRLTGRHPLNCEPPMEDLMASGFITPPSLHYVRNHGAVPRLTWQDHRLTINGLVDTPYTLTMDELVALPSVTLPITLVCAGNRRKEENMLKKSIGFNWGPCAVSTGHWTGVRLGDLLRRAGVQAAGTHVSFRGPQRELPKGSDGSYGTSLTMHYAMDDANDVLIAYKQNGRWLTPDHGFPVRIIIPGFIGGRMVKWLEEITVTPAESDNFYHFHDNRVMPPHVDEELAKKEGWWFKPDFIINELNINSAVSRPWHDEVLPLATNAPYDMKGYAYTGGGRKIIRVEVSLDGGVLWRQAEITRHETPTPAGKYWCWIFWQCTLTTAEIAAASEILVRAWDSSMNTQPHVITWNLMGMMNNSAFRIRVHKHVDAQGNMGLRFQHPAPVQPGELGNVGWREEENAARGGAALQVAADEDMSAAAAQAAPVAAAVKAAVPAAVPAGSGMYTMEEVEAHNNEESCWFVHEGKVYDATPFLEDHPGGAESILISAGMDATDEFNSIHSSKAKGMLKDYYIGELVTAEAKAAAGAIAITAVASSAPVPPSTPPQTESTELIALDPRKKIAFKLAEKIAISHNVRRFRFALQTPEHKFGLPVGKHVFIYANIGGETVMRAYTPTSQDKDIGHFDLVVKIYRANEHPRFPEGGKMSQHLESLNVGDTIDVKGPVGHFVYDGRGAYTLNRKPATAKHINLIAGGTGITPCWQVIRTVIDDPEDTTQVRLLYANQCEDDILLREHLEELAAEHPDKFKLWYTLDRPPAEGWSYSSGFICEEMLREHLLPASPDAIVAMCGPPPMIKFACIPNLEKLGFTEAQMITF